jgi:hypothetical protein
MDAGDAHWDDVRRFHQKYVLFDGITRPSKFGVTIVQQQGIYHGPSPVTPERPYWSIGEPVPGDGRDFWDEDCITRA